MLVYAAAVTFPHENVQYVVNEIALRISHRRLYQASAALAILEGALCTWVLVRGLREQPVRRPVVAYWVLTIALIFGTWRLLTANNTELVHYPQYVPEGAALLAITLSPLDAIAWVTVFGGLDECFQYWHLMGGKPVPYDFNDIYMDLLGGAAGVLLAMAFFRCEPRKAGEGRKTRTGVIAILSITAAAIALAISGVVRVYEDKADPHHWFALSRDKPPTYWFVNPMFGPHRFHTLSPVEGPVLIFVTLGIYWLLDRRMKIIDKGDHIRD